MSLEVCGMFGCHHPHNPQLARIIKALREAGIDIPQTACPEHVRGALSRLKAKKEDEKRLQAQEQGRQSRSETSRGRKGPSANTELPLKLKGDTISKTNASFFLKIYPADAEELLRVGLLETDPWKRKTRQKTLLLTTGSVRAFVFLVLRDPTLESEDFAELTPELHSKLINRASYYYPQYLLGGVLD